jgi:hypothetical protein
MSHVICGLDALTTSPVRVEVTRTIVEVAPDDRAETTYLAPGLIDLQVNGFAGLDYNAPHTRQTRHCAIDRHGRVNSRCVSWTRRRGRYRGCRG